MRKLSQIPDLITCFGHPKTVCYILPVKTRQIAVSVVAKHEQSDLSLLIYADKTI